jgi:predicted RNA-binding protein with PUA-like domain
MNWLFKSEPETYSFDTLKNDKKTAWNGVRNFQARNFLKDCQVGEFALIYHSGKDKAVVGIAKIVKGPYPEHDPKKPGDWVQLDVAYTCHLKQSVPLAVLKAHTKLKNLLLIKQSRLSCMPITEVEFQTILELGETWNEFRKSFLKLK